MSQIPNAIAEIYEGTAKESGKPYKALKITVGRYTKLLFLSPFEMEYVENHIAKAQEGSFLDDDEAKKK